MVLDKELYMSTETIPDSQVDFDKDKFSIIDNFLPENEFLELKENVMWSQNFPINMVEGVGVDKRLTTSEAYNIEQKNKWAWYGVHIFYHGDLPKSEYFGKIQEIFCPKLYDLGVLKSLARIKLNFYPYTTKIQEHNPHQDQKNFIKAALFSLNTCNGFTRMHNGTKIDSVANRMVFFDGSQLHNSSTTSNAKARYNINFNFY